MSKTLINYDIVVQELTKNMDSISSQAVRNMAPTREVFLGEFRTIRLGAGRQKGMTSWMYSQLTEDTLVLAHGRLYGFIKDEYAQRFPNGPKATFMPGKTFHQFVITRKWKKVFVVDSGIYFYHNKYNTFYKRLADMVDDDVVIYMLN
ncbi:hypothetical protein BIZ83_gp036 [Erwinia phage vB_EamM_ChrisDB]|uniref:hypothetical protein n=1 Tax=Erwinia phage vB_EamM_ChrisDB TaxID=1883371 RepID=UPI00081CF27D|nr:hypothetical protein BIZ83_gp036 [Erwinia phage vB_EamM_ChrisDB]ANZ48817.1 hypothetical protein CHRISDB_255 [Erwinia phage vB_EamM_ChrisDB]